MAAPRGEFSSKLGFIMAAAGSAVGLGNIWGFPKEVASNGGAAFLVIYLAMAFLIAYPALMAELIIGRHAKANPVEALKKIGNSDTSRTVGVVTGFAGIATACLILSFYSIIAGWMASNTLASLSSMAGMNDIAAWFSTDSINRSLIFTAVFMALTIAIITGGVKDGIEKWCSRLMPSLLVILALLIVYVMTLDGAIDGVKAYLLPDFSRVASPDLYISAMGQAFFSLSLGVGTMLIYGSYVPDEGNLVSLGRSVTIVDISIAFIAGLLIIPAMYVALTNGVQIYDANGALLAEDSLIFVVLPELFASMGGAGTFASLAFFILMSLAALTSTISILEVPVAYTTENHKVGRKPATVIIGVAIFLVAVVLIYNFEALFGLIVSVATQYGEPLVGLMMCIFAGWIFHRNTLLKEIQKGHDGAEHGLFWKIWPNYVRFVCPAAILIIFARKFFA
ncbi:MAG: sodium-dependent transporter [Woeseiaceae bacterium]|nr:sodium-dependent transporter [Woeseiaceae bacterium]